MVLRGRLPLDHDGLVRPAAGDDVLWRGGGGLLGEGDPGEENTGSGWGFPLLAPRANTRVSWDRRRLNPALLCSRMMHACCVLLGKALNLSELVSSSVKETE